MKIISTQKLRVESSFRRWEGSEGAYILDTYASVQTTEPVFGHVIETKGSRAIREGVLYEALSEEFSGRTGGHPFEVASVQDATSFTVKFRSGYSRYPSKGVEQDEDDDEDSDEN